MTNRPFFTLFLSFAVQFIFILFDMSLPQPVPPSWKVSTSF